MSPIYATPRPRPPKHVFHLATPHHMLLKLAWEIAELKKEIEAAPSVLNGVNHVAYRAFNTAVTAIHCADWMWRSIDLGMRQNVAASLSFAVSLDERTSLDQFLKAVCARSRAIEICRAIANGSKHSGADRLRGEPFHVETIWQFNTHNVPPQTETILIVKDADEERRVEEIFDGAFKFWKRLYQDCFLIEGTFVV